jgi:hypothetical protein
LKEKKEEEMKNPVYMLITKDYKGNVLQRLISTDVREKLQLQK